MPLFFSLLGCGLEDIQFLRAIASLLTFSSLLFDSYAGPVCLRGSPLLSKDKIFISDSCLKEDISQGFPKVRHRRCSKVITLRRDNTPGNERQDMEQFYTLEKENTIQRTKRVHLWAGSVWAARGTQARGFLPEKHTNAGIFSPLSHHIRLISTAGTHITPVYSHLSAIFVTRQVTLVSAA